MQGPFNELFFMKMFNFTSYFQEMGRLRNVLSVAERNERKRKTTTPKHLTNKQAKELRKLVKGVPRAHSAPILPPSESLLNKVLTKEHLKYGRGLLPPKSYCSPFKRRRVRRIFVEKRAHKVYPKMSPVSEQIQHQGDFLFDNLPSTFSTNPLPTEEELFNKYCATIKKFRYPIRNSALSNLKNFKVDFKLTQKSLENLRDYMEQFSRIQMGRIKEVLMLQKDNFLKRLDEAFSDIIDCEVKDQIREKLLKLDLLELDTDVLNYLRKDFDEWSDIPLYTKDIMKPTKRWIQNAYDKVRYFFESLSIKLTMFFCLFYWGGGFY